MIRSYSPQEMNLYDVLVEKRFSVYALGGWVGGGFGGGGKEPECVYVRVCVCFPMSLISLQPKSIFFPLQPRRQIRFIFANIIIITPLNSLLLAEVRLLLRLCSSIILEQKLA